MPVVGYVPPEEAPEPMAFFSYGCCISTSQALWVLITTFMVAILMIILCVMSAIFVRWVYKRRLRKKIESIKERYHKEEREKREREQELHQIAKRPVLPRPLLPANEPYKSPQPIVYQQPNPNMLYMWQQQQQQQQQRTVPDLAERTAIAKEFGAVPSFDRSLKPPERGEMIFDGEQQQKMKKMTLMVEPATVAGVIHEMAKGDVTLTPDQKLYPYIGLGYAQNEPEPTQPASNNSTSDPESKLTKDSVTTTQKKTEETTEESTQNSDKDHFERSIVTIQELPVQKAQELPKIQELSIQKTQEDSPDANLEKKMNKSRIAKKDKSPPGPSDDFPYYRPKKSLPGRSKATIDESASYQSTQKTGATPSPPKIIPETNRFEPQVKAYNVYELRRLADEQAGVAETENACEMIRNRNPVEGQKKLDLGQPVTKRIAQIQKVEDLKMEIQSPPSS